MKRFAAMLVVSVLMVLWIASGDRMSAGQRTDGLYYEVTGIHPDAVLMRINGEDISAEEYLYWLAYDCEYLTSYVPNLDFSAEVSNGMTYGSYAKADAVETVKLYALLRQWAKQYNVSLTEEDEARIERLLKPDYNTSRESSGNLGIANVNQRLRILYGEESGLSIFEKNDGVQAKIKILIR